MRLSISKSKNSTSLYVIKSTYENSVHSSKIVEKLGTVAELEKKLNGQDPIEWAKKYIEELNKKVICQSTQEQILPMLYMKHLIFVQIIRL